MRALLPCLKFKVTHPLRLLPLQMVGPDGQPLNTYEVQVSSGSCCLLVAEVSAWQPRSGAHTTSSGGLYNRTNHRLPGMQTMVRTYHKRCGHCGKDEAQLAEQAAAAEAAGAAGNSAAAGGQGQEAAGGVRLRACSGCRRAHCERLGGVGRCGCCKPGGTVVKRHGMLFQALSTNAIPTHSCLLTLPLLCADCSRECQVAHWVSLLGPCAAALGCV